MQGEVGGGGRFDLAQALEGCRCENGAGMTPSVDSHEARLAPLRDSRPRDVDAGLRRTLEDPVKTGRHPLGVIAVVVTITAIVLIGDSS